MKFWTHSKPTALPETSPAAQSVVRPVRVSAQPKTAPRVTQQVMRPQSTIGISETPVSGPVSARSRHPSDSDLLESVLQKAQLVDPVVEQPAQIEPKTEISWSLPGFDRRCRVSTIFGELPIEALRRRDKVKTLSGAYCEVQWVDAIRLDADFMSRHSEAHPVQLRAKSLGPGQPVRNILISPGQLICAKGQVGNKDTAPAWDFEGFPGIGRLPQTEMTYYRFHCGETQTVCIEGAWFCIER